MSIVAKTAALMNMPLGTEVGLGPFDVVLDGDPHPLPNFRPMSIAAYRWMEQDATGYGDRPRPRPHCVRT